MLTTLVTREVAQPNGTTTKWFWARREDDSSYFLLTDEGVSKLDGDWGAKVANKSLVNGYFDHQIMQYGMQYFTFLDRGWSDNPLSLDFPPGQLVCEVRNVFGKADERGIQALGLESEPGRDVWLEAKLQPDSAWTSRAMDVADWSPGKETLDFMNALVFKKLTLEPGQTRTIRVASPHPSSQDESEIERTD
jgi:hypothetical protein